VAPAALYLVSEDAPNNVILGAGAGGFHSAWVTMNDPVLLPKEERTPEAVAAHWEAITDRKSEFVPQSGIEQTGHVLAAMQKAAPAGG
jgi:hypothetical protein